MKHQFEVCQIFVDFFRLVKIQFGKFIKRLWLDNGTEFVNLEFSKFLKHNSVIDELTCVNTSQQNKVVESKNRHLPKVARALLFQMSVSNIYWGETILTATYLINRIPTHVLNVISPIKYMLSFFPSSPLMLSLTNHLFGCVTFVHSHNPHCGKLDPRVVKCVFISYPSNKKGFKCYYLPSHQGESYLKVEPIIKSLPFLLKMFKFKKHEKPTLIPQQVQLSKSEVSILENLIGEVIDDMLEVSIHENSIEDVTYDMPIVLRKGKRSCVKYPISQFMCIDHLSIQHQKFITTTDAIKTPTSVQETLKDEN
ncbi:hypothetical protein CR513_41923, partial [Mucuna pruriens]